MIDAFFIRGTITRLVRTAILATPLVRPFLDPVIEIKQQFWNYPIDSQRAWFATNVSPHDLHVLAYDEDGKILGYARLALSGATATVDTVCVDQSLHRKGIGTTIMRAADQVIAGNELYGLLCCRDELEAFYASCGWSVTDKILLRPGEITMQRIMSKARHAIFARDVDEGSVIINSPTLW
jgi:N-acetylglutamate synthase-like GNAT family acetyltransferase